MVKTLIIALTKCEKKFLPIFEAQNSPKPKFLVNQSQNLYHFRSTINDWVRPILTKYEIENSNQLQEIKFLWVDPFQKWTSPINLPLSKTNKMARKIHFQDAILLASFCVTIRG